MRILLLSRYDRKGASSRIRSYQYLPYLKKNGILVTSKPLFGDDYLEILYSRKSVSPKLIFSAYMNRLASLLRYGSFDLIWIEKEIFPWLPACAESVLNRVGIPLVVDFDDAIFHRYDKNHSQMVRCLLGKKINHVVKCASLVIGGNQYLCGYFKNAGAQWVELLPSVIDLERYHPSPPQASKAPFTIGWIGSPTTSTYLYKIAPVLSSFIKSSGSRLVLVGSGNFKYDALPVEIKQWREDREVQDVYEFDVGIMPLDDSPWAMGKCGYKLIQYMACAKPVIATKNDANNRIVQDGVSGFLVESERDWQKALRRLHSNADLRKKMGDCGRRIVEKNFCVQKTADLLSSWFWRLHNDNRSVAV